jgi:GxxExxY protein
MNSNSGQPDSLSKKIIAEAMYVHRNLGPGYLETIYHNALLLRLKELGLKVESQNPLPVYFDGEMVGDFLADIIVEDCLILELETVSALSATHEAQLLNCLTAAKIETGLLLNFGAKSFEFKLKSRTLAPSTRSDIPELAAH